MVGQRAEAARSMMAAILLSAAAQRPPGESLSEGNGARFYLLESPRVDADTEHTLAGISGTVPHSTRVVSRREVAQTLDELAAEIQRRHADDHGNYPDVFVFVHDLARFRDLRADENEGGFSFSSEAKPPSPDKQFYSILREGPSVGVFTIVWCDTLNNLSRTIDRQGLREFDLRVLFQMSQNDSSFLADTPAASKLGPQLALIVNEETALLEKFRPYAWPAADWLMWAAGMLRGPLEGRPSQKPDVAQSEVGH
jgi:hypothetical protein